MKQITINNLTKNYRRKTIFRNVNLKLTNEKINFLVGDNGSGKSTFIKCLLNQVKYEGIIDKCNLLIGYAPEKVVLPDYMTMKDYLITLSKINSNSKDYSSVLKYYMSIFSIEKYYEQPIYKLSKGTKQKITLIQALMSNSDIYIFDEPLNGLDERSQRFFINDIRRLFNLEKIIIISTHYLDSYKFKNKMIINFPLGDENEIT